MSDSNIQDLNSSQFAQPKVNSRKGFSPIWILPIVALLIGLGLIVKSYLNAGIMITLKVRTAEGIEVGKTQVLYKGISTGVVKSLEVADDLQHVILSIEMDKRTEPYLNEKSKFWVVEPRVSLAGVSGLDTILKGRYIAIDSERSDKAKRNFTALDLAPPPSGKTPGLHIKLRLNHLGSVDRGTVVYYKQIPVGEVINYTLEENDSEIHAWVVIRPKYAHLLKKNSRFYNVSGMTIRAGLSGIEVKTESIISMLAGGIAFHTPVGDDSEPAKLGSLYLLYDDFENAQVGIPVVLRFKDISSLQENMTKIKYQGQVIGRLGVFAYDKQKHESLCVANLAPQFAALLTENTQFWIVKPSVSLIKISGLDALLEGSYIEIRPSAKGKKTREFLVNESVPVTPYSVPGLHFTIVADSLGSLKKDTPLYFKKIQVGKIEGFSLTEKSNKVRLQAYIKPEFSHLVKKSTRFYNVSGVNIKGGLTGLKITTESLTSLISGGIALYTPEYKKDNTPAENGAEYSLYKDYDDAKAGIEISLIFTDTSALTVGVTRVVYKGFELGVVKEITPDSATKTATAKVIMNPIAESGLVEDSKFWVVRPKVALTGVKNLETLFTGDYITLRRGNSKKKKRSFKVYLTKPPLDLSHPGLHLKLNSSELGSISIGAPVMYHRIKIGDVQDYELATDRKSINILIHILPQYIDLVTRQSRFYNASGFKVDLGLSGMSVRTESIDSIINGGVALYNDENYQLTPAKTKPVSNGTLFKLFENYDAARQNAFYVKVQFKSISDIAYGSRVIFNDLTVGKVKSVSLNQHDPEKIEVTLELDSKLKPLLGKNSKFWVVKARLGLAKVENAGNIIKGNYLQVEPVKGRFSDRFIGLENKPLVKQSENGFNISLSASRLGSVKVGDPVYYRQIKVGEVVGYELADTSDQILIHLSIRERFRPLLRENSQFWHASGISMDINLFGQSKIRTESVESVLSGGIAFATPDNDNMGKMLASGSYYILHDEPQPQWFEWNPVIPLSKETQQN